MPALISAAEFSLKPSPTRVILDASKVFDENAVIPGAIRFDLSGVFSDTNSPYPNTMPGAKEFETACQNLGINSDADIVVYDRDKIFNSTRVWYMFQSMGHRKVRVLDGGMPQWVKQGGKPTAYNPKPLPKGNFKAQFTNHAFRNIDWVKNNIISSEAVLIDARSSGRFQGTAPEPRPGLRSGSIPNSCNLPFTEVLENGVFKSSSKLQEIFRAFEDQEKPFVFSCGSGVTACILLLAAHLAGYNNVSVYDGSWTEWASTVEQ